MLNLYLLVGFGTLLAIFAIWLLKQHFGQEVHRWFAAYTLAMSGWTMGLAVLHAGIATDLSSRLVFAVASFIPGCFLAFTRVYPTPSTWPSPNIIRVVLGIGAVFSILSLTTSLLIHDAAFTPAGFVRKSGRLYPIFAFYFLTTWVTALAVFIAKWRRARGHAKAQLQYLGLGLIISGVGGISTNLLMPLLLATSAYTWVGPFFTFPLVVLVGHAIIRHRLMDLRLVIHRSIASGVATAGLSISLIAVTRFTAPAWQSHPLILQPDILIVAVVVLVTLSTPVQRLLHRFVDPYLYRGRLDYAASLHAMTRRLSHRMPPAALAAELHNIVVETVVPESFVMVTDSQDGVEELSSDNPALMHLLASSREVVDFVTAQSSPSVIVLNPTNVSGAERDSHLSLREAGVEVLMTLGRRGQLLGHVFLGPRKSGDAYFTAELKFIETLAELTSIALENALLYRQRVEALEYSDRLLESLDSAVVAVDVTGRITSFNPAAMTLLGLESNDRGSSLEILPLEIGWALALATSGAWLPREVEVTIEHRLRGLLPTILSTAVLHDDLGQVTGALAVVTDLSTVKSLERNQRRVEHLAMMARFYTGIAHEIRSPLASISNLVSMLPDRFDDPEYRDTAARLLPVEVGRIVRLADRLRLMAPSEGGSLKHVKLRSLLEDIVAIHSPAAENRGVKIMLQCPRNLPAILGDQAQLVQLFVNLLNNAIEAMPDGGKVKIEAAEWDDGTSPNPVVVRIIDEGIGIPPSLRAKVFEPFFTTKPSGTGLGLSICREIADFHRAQLLILPRLDSNGTVVQVMFSAALAELRT